MPITGRVVFAAMAPARCAALPAAAMIAPNPFSRALEENSAASTGVRCAEMILTSQGIPSFLSVTIAGFTVCRSLSLPMTTATRFISIHLLQKSEHSIRFASQLYILRLISST